MEDGYLPEEERIYRRWARGVFRWDMITQLYVFDIWRHYLFDRRARIEDWRRVRVEYSRNICIFLLSFSLYICFRLCWISIRQVRNVGTDRSSILLVTHHKQYFKEKQRTLLSGRNLITVSHRSHLKRQHLMTRIQPFLYPVHSKMSLRSSRWNMTTKCQSCSVIRRQCALQMCGDTMDFCS